MEFAERDVLARCFAQDRPGSFLRLAVTAAVEEEGEGEVPRQVMALRCDKTAATAHAAMPDSVLTVRRPTCRGQPTCRLSRNSSSTRHLRWEVLPHREEAQEELEEEGRGIACLSGVSSTASRTAGSKRSSP